MKKYKCDALVTARTFQMSLFSLHVGKSPELNARDAPTKFPRHLAVGDIRTHIRLPGGVFAVSIYDEQGAVVYAAVNAGPMEANGHVAVRWKVPKEGTTYHAVLWKQRDRIHTKMFGALEFETCLKSATKVTELWFSLL